LIFQRVNAKSEGQQQEQVQLGLLYLFIYM